MWLLIGWAKEKIWTRVKIHLYVCSCWCAYVVPFYTVCVTSYIVFGNDVIECSSEQKGNAVLWLKAGRLLLNRTNCTIPSAGDIWLFPFASTLHLSKGWIWQLKTNDGSSIRSFPHYKTNLNAFNLLNNTTVRLVSECIRVLPHRLQHNCYRIQEHCGVKRAGSRWGVNWKVSVLCCVVLQR